MDGFKYRLEKAEIDLDWIKQEMDEWHAIDQIERLYTNLDINKKAECLHRLKNL
jgi:hypothetical protein